MKYQVIKSFLFGTEVKAEGDLIEPDERVVPMLLRSGVIAIPRAREVETTTARMDDVETTAKRGPGRPRKDS